MNTVLLIQIDITKFNNFEIKIKDFKIIHE